MPLSEKHKGNRGARPNQSDSAMGNRPSPRVMVCNNTPCLQPIHGFPARVLIKT
ncbi:hypothetical protein APED_29290 [Acanthopleuribacter pedis]